MIYNLGASVPLTWVAPFDWGQYPETQATLTVTDTAGVPHVQTLTTATGTYSAWYTPTAYGLYSILWEATAAGESYASQDVFEVRPDAPKALVSMDDVTDYLNLPASVTVDDNKIQRLIEAASNIVLDITGPMKHKQYTEWFDGGIATVSPAQKPIMQVLSASEYYGITEFVLTEQPLGFQTDAFAFTVDYITGQITRRTYGGAQAQFAIGSKNVRITYQAGRPYVPENVQVATLELVRFWYTQTQVPASRNARGGSAGESLDALSIGYAVPNFVIEMLQPHRRAPGIA